MIIFINKYNHYFVEVHMGIPKYDSSTAARMIHAFVPISRFNKGEAGKIIEEVKTDGVRVVVKNNEPECVMLSIPEYDRYVRLANTPPKITFTKEEEEKRKAFIAKIRQNVQPPIPATRKLADVIKEVGPIDVDEDAVWELRRIDRLMTM